MADKVIGVGNKIELTVMHDKTRLKTVDERNYVSQIFDFDGDDIIAALPMYEGHLVTLEVDSRLDCYFYTPRGIFRGTARITSRYKEKNLYLMKLEQEGELRKFQRRQYYRLPCNIGAQMRTLEVAEVLDYSAGQEPVETLETVYESGVIVDISGGGVRIFTPQKYEKDDYLYVKFSIDMNVGRRDLELLTRVVMCIESHGKDDYYDVRVQYKDIPPQIRDSIVKYIYEQQRKIQSKGR
jgi:c-di-GMP-binding flagellar brake protein YcgR